MCQAYRGWHSQVCVDPALQAINQRLVLTLNLHGRFVIENTGLLPSGLAEQGLKALLIRRLPVRPNAHHLHLFRQSPQRARDRFILRTLYVHFQEIDVRKVPYQFLYCQGLDTLNSLVVGLGCVFDDLTACAIGPSSTKPTTPTWSEIAACRQTFGGMNRPIFFIFSVRDSNPDGASSTPTKTLRMSGLWSANIWDA